MKNMPRTTKQMLDRFSECLGKLPQLLQGLHRDLVARLAVGRALCRGRASTPAG
jgi:hypothetical protein